MVSQEYLTEVKEGLTESKEELTLTSESYLKGIVDFVKWTSTVAITVMLWIGNNMASIVDPSRRLVAIFALVSLTMSLFTAICTIKRVLDAWKKEWDYANANALVWGILYLKATIPDELLTPQIMASLEQETLEALGSVDNASRAVQPMSQFNTCVVWHMVFLLAGPILYILAQVPVL